MMLPNVICVLTSCNIRLENKYHQYDTISLSPIQPNVPRIWRNLIDYKCTITVRGRFLSFSPKMFKQIDHPIYGISQLKVLYRIVSKKLAQYTALVCIEVTAHIPVAVCLSVYTQTQEVNMLPVHYLCFMYHNCTSDFRYQRHIHIFGFHLVIHTFCIYQHIIKMGKFCLI